MKGLDGKPNNRTIIFRGCTFMKDVEFWNVFEETGSIDAYLLYACSSEKTQLDEGEEGENNHESGKYYGNGTFRYTSRGI